MNRSYQYRGRPAPHMVYANRMVQNTCPCEEAKPESREIACDSMVLAMSYVLMQELNTVYEPDVGFHHGTIFPELDKPFLAGGMTCG